MLFFKKIILGLLVVVAVVGLVGFFIGAAGHQVGGDG